jgi:hypothetical protein
MDDSWFIHLPTATAAATCFPCLPACMHKASSWFCDEHLSSIHVKMVVRMQQRFSVLMLLLQESSPR